jgi:hypothetical protein
VSPRFAISFDSWFKAVSAVAFLPPAQAYVTLEGSTVEVRMGWAFGATFERSAIQALRGVGGTVLNRGVHGIAGRWLVNGSARGLVTMQLEPAQRARVIAFPLKVHELTVSLDDPVAFAAALDLPLLPPAP